VRQSYRVYVRYMAAEKALKAERYGLETPENIRENLISDFITDTGSHMCRRNEFAEQGIERQVQWLRNEDVIDEDDGPDTTLGDFNGEEDDEPGVQDQLTLEQAIDESHQDTEDIDYFTMITNRSVKGPGINPDDNPIAHDSSETAWGIGRIYRDRWSVETAFRDRKETFQARTTSRDLGYRRFLWMMANLLYNGWVLLNTAVADQSPDRDDDEIVVKQATYLDELDRRVLSEIPGMEFPGLDYG